jgi:hypothetical protein
MSALELFSDNHLDTTPSPAWISKERTKNKKIPIYRKKTAPPVLSKRGSDFTDRGGGIATTS